MKNKKSFDNELLSNRVLFKNQETRNQFFERLRTLFGNWTKVSRAFKIYKSKLERFRSGIYSLPYSTFSQFLTYLDEKERQFFLNSTVLRDKNWGRSKGGSTTYKKYKQLFDEGRKIGSMKTKYHFDIKMPITPELSELIGAFIGDGFTNNYQNSYVVQYTGHSKLDKEYMENRLVPYIKRISPSSNPIIRAYENTLRVTINSKEFHDLLTQRFNFPAGKKSYSVVIPQEIMMSNGTIINNCIRGIFDTDGCVFVDKRSAYKNPYLRICLDMRSKELIKQVHSILIERGINARVIANFRIIQINGIKNCKKFIELIGFNNRRHLDKIKGLQRMQLPSRAFISF